jgi:hypothetical protein
MEYGKRPYPSNLSTEFAFIFVNSCLSDILCHSYQRTGKQEFSVLEE